MPKFSALRDCDAACETRSRRLAAVQRRIDSTIATLHETTDATSSLLPYERCVLSANRSCASLRAGAPGFWGRNRCGAGCSGAPHDWVARRYTAVTSTQGSHLVAALRALGGAAPIVFMGDSMSRQISQAAKCELGRALGPGSSAAAAMMSRIVYSDITKSERERDRLTREFVRVAESAKGAGDAALLVANLGLHYNNRELARAEGTKEMSRRELGRRPRAALQHLRHFHSARGRGEFDSRTRQLLRLLDAFGRACPRCAGVYRTATPQHFATATGAYVARERNPSAYPCKPLRPASAAADDNPNRWRVADALAEAKNLSASGRVVVVPVHAYLGERWDAHFGTARTGAAVDCSHFCPSPFLWEPLWAALRMVAEGL